MRCCEGHPCFFILGAPKCGTTSLARWLEANPQIFLSPVKEPHFFSTDLANRNITSEAAYRRLFRGAGPECLALGEASTWYLFSEEAVPAIERMCPVARYIVMTRDPVEMAHSLYHHNRRVLHEDQPSFGEAWALQEERSAGRRIPSECAEPAFLQYQAACSLGSLLQRLYDYVPKERVLHIPLENIRLRPGLEYRRALSFLGVEDDGRTEFHPVNEARGYRSGLVQRLIHAGANTRQALGVNRGFGLARLNEKPKPKELLSASFRAELEIAFAAERLKLVELGPGEL